MLTTFHKTDAEIAEQVVQELRWDCRTETSPIQVGAKNGVVMLTGRVKYYAIKHAAEEAARRIAGVTAVQDEIEIRIPSGEYRGDCEIAEAVRRAFDWNVLIPADRIETLVNKGIVNLSGTVDCLSEREEAERAVVNLLGVQGICNDLMVEAHPIAIETLCADIRNTLERQAVTVTPEVRVEAAAFGAIHLSGSVPSWSQRCAVVAAAGFAHGVQQIVDHLNVVPLSQPV
jgi:osmotically-inducible protein OsmY